MGQKIELTAFVLARKESYMTKPEFSIASYDASKSEHNALNFMYVGEFPVSYEIPETFNLNASQIDVLQREKDQISREFAERVKRINDRISELQCIEYNPTEAA
jgi:hypothetical protein